MRKDVSMSMLPSHKTGLFFVSLKADVFHMSGICCRKKMADHARLDRVCVCACVRASVRAGVYSLLALCARARARVRVCVCACVRACVRACVCVRARSSVCVCVCFVYIYLFINFCSFCLFIYIPLICMWVFASCMFFL